MGKVALGLLLVFALCAVGSASAYYTDAQIVKYINQFKDDQERTNVITYGVIRGYELVERRSSGMETPHINFVMDFRMIKAIYQYYLKYHTVNEVVFPYPSDIICFPSGCIEIDDPGIHP